MMLAFAFDMFWQTVQDEQKHKEQLNLTVGKNKFFSFFQFAPQFSPETSPA
jgi:hypothetical protein